MGAQKVDASRGADEDFRLGLEAAPEGGLDAGASRVGGWVGRWCWVVRRELPARSTNRALGMRARRKK